MNILKPNLHLDSILDLTISYLKDHGIDTLFIDIDNTIIDPRTWQFLIGFREWLEKITTIEKVEDSKINVFFVSNTLSAIKGNYIEQQFDKEVIIKAYKPLPIGFRYAIDRFGLKGKEGSIAVVGDHPLTDILGGNLLGLHTIKVRPVTPNLANNTLLRILYNFKELIYCLQNNIPIIPQEEPAKILSLQTTN